MRVILIERDPELRNALAFSLDLEGFSVQPVGAINGVDLAVNAQSADCLVIAHDPNNVDGFEALVRVATVQSHLPTIVLATNPSALLRSRTAETGAHLIEKPLIGDALSEALRSLIPLQHEARSCPTFN